MLRRFELAFYLAIIAAAVLYGAGLAEKDSAGERRPRPDYSQRDMAPKYPDPFGGEVVEIKVSRKTGNSVGTAYAVSSDLWMTAAHVVRDCDSLALVVGPRQGIRPKSVWVHPDYDLALIETKPLGQPVLAPATIRPRRGDEGFHIGYPGGKPGDIVSRKMTEGQMHTRGAIERLEPIDIWAERARFPESLTTLGGISGGPVFNDRGEVVGSTVAGTVRRGRAYTTPMTSLQDMLDRAGKAWQQQPNEPAITRPLSESAIVTAGNSLREKLAVVQLYCTVR